MLRTIPTRETLRIEFKSDAKCLSVDELILAAVCLANAESGDLYIGVEDDGTITGLHPTHQNSTTLAALIANRTSPPLSVRATILHGEGHQVAHLEVPKSSEIVSTSTGTVQRRRLQQVRRTRGDQLERVGARKGASCRPRST